MHAWKSWKLISANLTIVTLLNDPYAGLITNGEASGSAGAKDGV
jgi:hypothetical protein